MIGITEARIKLKRDTTAHWNAAQGFIPLAGEVIIYTDYETKTYTVEEYGETVTKTVDIPNIKIDNIKTRNLKLLINGIRMR